MNIYDIAKEAGVSIATVSRVLNNNPGVSTKTRRIVEAVLLKNRYTPNAIARGLVVKSIRTVGILTIDIRDVYYAHVAYTIERKLGEMGLSAILCNTGGQKNEKIKYLNLLLEKKVDGIILVGSVFKDPEIDDAIINAAERVPLIMVNGFIDDERVYSILCDEKGGIEQVIDHLAAKGHQNIVYVKDVDTYSAGSKLEGYLSGLAKHGLEKYSRYVQTRPGLAGGAEGVDYFVQNKLSFTAVVTGDDITAAGVIKRLAKSGLRIPADVAVTGFNNSIICQCTHPEMTTVDNRMEQMGEKAVEILGFILQGQAVKNKTMLIPQLVVREST